MRWAATADAQPPAEVGHADQRRSRATGLPRVRRFRPVLERALARNAGLGWIGKHTCLIDRHGGSWFFIGEIYIDIPLPIDTPATAHCGTCTRCIDVRPTQAITGPQRLDARRCISYLTIEHDGAIPEQMRPLIGNRIYGCDDCQLVCPWNKFAKRTDEADFRARNNSIPRA